MPYNFVDRQTNHQWKFRVSSGTPDATSVDQFEPIHNWKWLSDYSSPITGSPLNCIFYSSFGVKSSSMTQKNGCQARQRLNLANPWDDPGMAGNAHERVGVRYSDKSVLGLEFWNSNPDGQQGFIDKTCYPTTNTLEYYGGPLGADTISGTEGLVMTEAQEIRLIFELDYTNSKSNLKYIEIFDNDSATRIGNTDTTKPQNYIQFDIHVEDSAGLESNFHDWSAWSADLNRNRGEFLGTQAVYTDEDDVYEFGFYYRDNECDHDKVNRTEFMCTGEQIMAELKHQDLVAFTVNPVSTDGTQATQVPIEVTITDPSNIADINLFLDQTSLFSSPNCTVAKLSLFAEVEFLDAAGDFDLSPTHSLDVKTKLISWPFMYDASAITVSFSIQFQSFRSDLHDSNYNLQFLFNLNSNKST